MDPKIKSRYNNNILAEAMYRFGIEADQIHLLDGFESFIYEFERAGDEYILRVGHSSRRPTALIRGEVGWINYLAKGGASVARAITSQNNKLVEPILDGFGQYFLATAFEKAPGKPPWEVGWTPKLYVNYGRLLGRIHQLSKDYQPVNTTGHRPQWDDPEILDIEGNLPSSEEPVLARLYTLVTHLEDLPREREGYGLIHFDAHGGNILIDGDGRITLFDFDDCCYSWYIYDIAILFFYIVMGQEDVNSFTHHFMRHFLDGYTQETSLEPCWLAQIPHFLKLREIDLYAVIHRSFDVEQIDDPWCARYMDGRKQKIENGIPYVDFDFNSLVKYL